MGLHAQAGATAVGNVAQGVHATGVTATNAAQAVQTIAGRRHMLQTPAQVLHPLAHVLSAGPVLDQS